MAFDPSKITGEHIIQAAAQIVRKEIEVNTSTGYDVIINGKAFPPKEILRISYKIATSEDIGVIYGGKEVNIILEKLGFEVRIKMKIWKLGCHWERGNPSFYEFLKSESIVISVVEYPYKIGDLVLITEGFTVYAIAKVLEQPVAITDNLDFEHRIDYYNIPYIPKITYSKAEWYELPQTEIFNYSLQQGIRQVRKGDIIEKAINIWENRDLQFSNLTYYVYSQRQDLTLKYPCFILYNDRWDDFGYKTSFQLSYYKTEKEKVFIGNVKILDRENDVAILNSEFKSLKDNFCSLGQTLNYYQNLKAEFPDTYVDILKNLRDTAFDISIRDEFEGLDGFKKSLLRSSEAELTLNESKSLLLQIKVFKHDFIFSYQLKDALEAHKVNFSFNMDDQLRNRFFCIIGKNGTGKTQFISQLAVKLTNIEADGDFLPLRPDFSKIIAVSFSYFDDFKLPATNEISYEFIGLKSEKGVLDKNSIIDIVWKNFATLSQNKNEKKLLLYSLKNTLEIENLGFSVDFLESVSTKDEFVRITEKLFSSGQKILFHLLVRLIATIDYNSLIIFDEPETHLHPNMVAKLLRTLNYILRSKSSFCIFSTHSPIIIQEIPSKYINVFVRHENTPIIFEPVIECLGENLANINNSIFQVEQENTLYQDLLTSLQENSFTEIESFLERPLSLNARLFLQSLKTNL